MRALKFHAAGKIMHTFVSEIIAYIEEFNAVISMLHDLSCTNRLTLGNLLLIIRPYLRSLGSLRHIFHAFSPDQMMSGGQLIRHLEELLVSNTLDTQTVLLFNRLVHRCNKVFDAFLADWVLRGVLDDRHVEFMIARKEYSHDSLSISGDFLESDFYVCEAKVPLRYDGIKQSILHIGIILGALRTIGHSVLPSEIPISTNIHDEIHRIFLTVNSMVMNTLRADSRLRLYFADILNSFFLERSDFAHEFLAFVRSHRQLQSFSMVEYLTKNSDCAVEFGPLRERLHFKAAEKGLYESLFRVLSVGNGAIQQQKLVDGKHPYFFI